MKRRKCKTIVQKLSYTFLAIMTFFSQANIPYMVYALADDVNYDTISVADANTSNIEDLYNNSESDDGMIMTDKSVDHVEEDLFDITLSALGQGFETKKTVATNKKLDVVFVLDVSGSMENNDRYISMVNAVNTAIGTIMRANGENRVGVVTFSGSSDTLLSLDSYSTTNQYNKNDYLTYDEGDRRHSPSISVSNNVRNSDGSRVSGSEYIVGGTYTQSGMARGANQLINNNDTEDRVPVIILLSDGEPTYYTSNYNNVGRNHAGDGSSTSSNAAYYTIMTGKSYKDKVESNYNTDCK